MKRGINVILPVHNSPLSCKRLMDCLENPSDRDNVKAIYICDDNSDAHTSDFLETYSSTNSKITLIRNDVKEGFVSSVNKLYKLLGKTDEIGIVLKQDVILPEGWSEKVLNKFTDNKNALAVPLTNRSRFTHIVEPPGYGWKEVDEVLSYTFSKNLPEIFDSFPQSDPPSQNLNEGSGLKSNLERFSSGIVAFKGTFLTTDDFFFDPTYQDESLAVADLFFRTRSRGVSCTLIQNLFCYRAYSTTNSFFLTNEYHSELDLFLERWHSTFSGLSRPDLSAPYRAIEFRPRRSLDILFILPFLGKNCGGVKVVLQLLERLYLLGFSCGILCQGNIDSDFIDKTSMVKPYTSKSQLQGEVSAIKNVIYSYFGDYSLSKNISDSFGSKLVNLCQGPETSFNLGMFSFSTFSNLSNTDKIISVSPYLERYLANFSIKSSLVRITPDDKIFYDHKEERIPKSICAVITGNELKGQGSLLSNLYNALRAGFNIYLFGNVDPDKNHSDILGKCKILGPLDEVGVSDLFNKMEFFYSNSYLDGLGLPPLEAAYCGCVPILSKLNGLEDILTPEKDCILLPEDFPPLEFWTNLSKSREHFQTSSVNFKNYGTLDGAVLSLQRVLELERSRTQLNFQNYIPEPERKASEELASILNSRSWRITKPLRGITNYMRSLMKAKNDV